MIYRDWVLIVSLAFGVCQSAKAEVDVAAPSLMIKPNRCIALHRGQKCYQTVQLSWVLPDVGRYCLYLHGAVQPIVCWQADTKSQHQYEFESAESMTFYILDEQTSVEVASTQLEVVWVYKNRKKASSGWRLF